MKWLYKIFNAVPPSERKGINLTDPFWEITPIENIESFLLALPLLVPDNSILYLEGVGLRDNLRSFLEEINIVNDIKVEMGTIWPKPKCYQILITEKSMKELSEIAKKYVPCEVASHVHVYKDNNILLQWFDAFIDEPIFLSKDIAEENVKEFCNKTGTIYKRTKS
jgi:hypothetical protein